MNKKIFMSFFHKKKPFGNERLLKIGFFIRTCGAAC